MWCRLCVHATPALHLPSPAECLHIPPFLSPPLFSAPSRFLQGPGTDRAAVAGLRAAIAEGRECTVRLLNYKKDRSPFWNLLTVAPIRDGGGALRFMVGIQVRPLFGWGRRVLGGVQAAPACRIVCDRPVASSWGSVRLTGLA